MFDHDESFLVSSVVFGDDMWTAIGHLSYIHDIIITICVYCNIYIQDICKYCHEADNQF